MRLPRGWLEAALATADRLPVIDHWRIGVRRGLVLGMIGGGLLFLLVGAVLGAVNRGAAGMLIGGLSSALGGLVLGALIGAALGPAFFYDSSACTLEIRLDGSEGPFAPGDTVSGHVLLTAHRGLQVTGGGVLFMCRGLRTYDQLDGDPDGVPQLARETLTYVAEEANIIPARTIRRGSAVRYPFSFTITDEGLPTHHGNVCAVRWTLHAEVGVQRMPLVRAHHEVLVVSPLPQVRRTLSEYRSIATSDACHLLLSLPRVLFSPGEEIEATLRVTPKQGFAAEEIRAVLLRIEQIPAGDDHTVYIAEFNPAEGIFRGERREGGSGTTYVWLEDEVRLAGPTVVRATGPLSYTFGMPLPERWLPTMRSADGTVIWKLVAVLARAGKPDVRACHEIIVHTAAAHPSAGADGQAAGPSAGVRIRRISADED